MTLTTTYRYTCDACTSYVTSRYCADADAWDAVVAAFRDDHDCWRCFSNRALRCGTHGHGDGGADDIFLYAEPRSL